MEEEKDGDKDENDTHVYVHVDVVVPFLCEVCRFIRSCHFHFDQIGEHADRETTYVLLHNENRS